MLGMHGSAYANWAMRAADVIIAVGARFDDRITGNPAKFAATARAAERDGTGGFIHFEIAPENINKTVPVTIPVEGDAKKNLELLLPLLRSSMPLLPSRSPASPNTSTTSYRQLRPRFWSFCSAVSYLENGDAK